MSILQIHALTTLAMIVQTLTWIILKIVLDLSGRTPPRALAGRLGLSLEKISVDAITQTYNRCRVTIQLCPVKWADGGGEGFWSSQEQIQVCIYTACMLIQFQKHSVNQHMTPIKHNESSHRIYFIDKSFLSVCTSFDKTLNCDCCMLKICR